MLFNDTILNNIGYGRPEAPEEEIIKAAEMARLSDAIARMPNGESCPGCSACVAANCSAQMAALADCFERWQP